MTKEQFNIEINATLGTLAGLKEVTPACDKPCNVHAINDRVREHEMKAIATMAQYIGNGMSADIAKSVATALQENKQVPSPVTFVIPGTNKAVTMTKKAIADWAFRAALIGLLYVLVGGKIDKAAMADIAKEALKSQMVTPAPTPPVEPPKADVKKDLTP